MPFPGGTSDLSYKPEEYLVPTGARYMVIHRNEIVLTAGSDLNVTAQSSGALGNPWPAIISTYMRRLFKGSWRPNNLRPVFNRNVNANYGQQTSQARFAFRGREFGGVGSMPVGMTMWRDPRHPTYNVAAPIVYGLRDIDPKQLAQPGELRNVPVVQVGGTDFTPAGSASLQEVLL